MSIVNEKTYSMGELLTVLWNIINDVTVSSTPFHFTYYFFYIARLLVLIGTKNLDFKKFHLPSIKKLKLLISLPFKTHFHIRLASYFVILSVLFTCFLSFWFCSFAFLGGVWKPRLELCTGEASILPLNYIHICWCLKQALAIAHADLELLILHPKPPLVPLHSMH